ncbi:MAG: YkgJ family cysteine cluster protein [Armatimonadota bacterium]
MPGPNDIACFRCGTCCIAPDISTLGKPVGVPCPHLREDRLCGIYPERPLVCRDYRPDNICVILQQLPVEQRVEYYLSIFDLSPLDSSENKPPRLAVLHSIVPRE